MITTEEIAIGVATTALALIALQFIPRKKRQTFTTVNCAKIGCPWAACVEGSAYCHRHITASLRTVCSIPGCRSIPTVADIVCFDHGGKMQPTVRTLDLPECETSEATKPGTPQT